MDISLNFLHLLFVGFCLLGILGCFPNENIQDFEQLDDCLSTSLEIRPVYWPKDYGEYTGPVLTNCLEKYKIIIHASNSPNTSNINADIKVFVGDAVIAQKSNFKSFTYSENLSLFNSLFINSVEEIRIEITAIDTSDSLATPQRFSKAYPINLVNKNLAIFEACHYQIQDNGMYEHSQLIHCPSDSSMLMLCNFEGMSTLITGDVHFYFEDLQEVKDSSGSVRVAIAIDNEEYNYHDSILCKIELDTIHKHYNHITDFHARNKSILISHPGNGFEDICWSPVISAENRDYICSKYVLDCSNDSLYSVHERTHLGEFVYNVYPHSGREGYSTNCPSFTSLPQLKSMQEDENSFNVEFQFDYHDRFSIYWQGPEEFKSFSKGLKSVGAGNYTYIITNKCGETLTGSIELIN